MPVSIQSNTRIGHILTRKPSLAAMTMRLKISIVVPAFNEEKLIERSLQSIRDASSIFSRVGWEHEIIVCDNNSTDRTPELARAKGSLRRLRTHQSDLPGA